MEQWTALGYGPSIVALIDISVRLHQFETAPVPSSSGFTLETERYEKFLSVAERIILLPDLNICQVPRDLRNDLTSHIKAAELKGLDVRGYPGGKLEAQYERNYDLYSRLLYRNSHEALLRDSLQHSDFNLKLLSFLDSCIPLLVAALPPMFVR